MTSAIPNKIGAMKSITVPYRITRRITTAQRTLYDEVMGYGGGNCVKNFNITIRGKCVICPNSAAARVVERIASYLISIFYDCPTTITSSTPPTYVLPGGTAIYILPTSGQGTGGGLPGSSSEPLKTGNPCECKDNCEKVCENPEEVCIGGYCKLVKLTSVDAKVNGKDEDTVAKDEVVNFTSSPVGENCEYQYLWEFGDWITSTEANPSHTYMSTGVFNVNLEVSCKKCGPKVKDTVKVIVSSVKLCKRDLMGISSTEKIILEYLLKVKGELYHNFIWINGKTFGFSTPISDAIFTERCGIEGRGQVEPDLGADTSAATSGTMHGSCQAVECNNPDNLLWHIENDIPPYYCLSYNPLVNDSGGMNCQDWANMMIATYCN